MLHRLIKFLIKFFVRPVASPGIDKLYRACVTQARQPAFYADWQAPDTVDGRFDLLILHVLLLVLRLQGNAKAAQQLFDILFADMDRSLREMGVSDVGIPKKMKLMMSAFYGRADIYEKALAADDTALAEALRRNVYGRVTPDAAALGHLTAYVRRAQTALAQMETDAILFGDVLFPVVNAND